MKCRRCLINKDCEQFYTNKRNKSGYEHICKLCKSIETNARRYGVSEGFIEYLYSHKQCMCCNDMFINSKSRHIHHNYQGVQGLVCIHCNHILGQETEEDLQRIKHALAYMKSPRENLLDRDNQQERLRKFRRESKFVEESSETICCESQKCSQCKRKLTKNSFDSFSSRGTRKVCFECRRSNVRLSQSKQAVEARNKATNCDCCDSELVGKKCVHHISDKVYGVVCNRCNQLLGNESEQQKDRLLACKLWIEENLSWDYDRVRPAWRHAECSRNDCTSGTVAL